MPYIRGTREPDESCFLCDKSAQTDDEANLVVARGPHAIVLLNLYPYNTGHLLVAPLRHVAEPSDLNPHEVSEVWQWTADAIEALRRTSQPDGFNVGFNLGRVAGAGVPGHLHVHIVPRWSGDSNFMPILAQTKVLPEMLADTYRALRPLLKNRT